MRNIHTCTHTHMRIHTLIHTHTGVDITLVDLDSYTALHVALYYGFFRIAHVLIHHSHTHTHTHSHTKTHTQICVESFMSMRDNNGLTALDMCEPVRFFDCLWGTHTNQHISACVWRCTCIEEDDNTQQILTHTHTHTKESKERKESKENLKCVCEQCLCSYGYMKELQHYRARSLHTLPSTHTHTQRTHTQTHAHTRKCTHKRQNLLPFSQRTNRYDNSDISIRADAHAYAHIKHTHTHTSECAVHTHEHRVKLLLYSFGASNNYQLGYISSEYQITPRRIDVLKEHQIVCIICVYVNYYYCYYYY